MTLACRVVFRNWLYLRWPEPGDNKIGALRDLRKIESIIREFCLSGWLADSKYEYADMHKVLKKLGAKVYADDGESYHFYKEVMQ